MIEAADPGMRSAWRAAIGHAGPYRSDELAGLRTLRVVHARDLVDLRHCGGLTEIELVACDVDSLDEPARLNDLRALHVLACPITDAGPLAGHRGLVDLRLDFGLVTDITPLTTIGTLRRGRFLGLPLDPTSWHERRPAWQRGRTTDSDRVRLLEFGPTEAWEATRQAWECGVRLCFALLDGLLPTLVRPGLPSVPGVDVDAVRTPGVALILAAQRGESTDEILRRNREWATAERIPTPDDFRSRRELGDAADARRWIAAAQPSGRADFERFVARFPDGVFYREDAHANAARARDAGVPVPAGVAAPRSVLAGLLPDGGLRFRLDGLPRTSPRTDRAESIWYLPSVGVYSSELRRTAFRDDAGLFPLAEWPETGESLLVARLGDRDPAVYEFAEQDLYDALSAGSALAGPLHRVFDSYAAMLAAVAAVRWPDGTESAAVTTPDDGGDDEH